jgi:hypothetical protein
MKIDPIIQEIRNLRDERYARLGNNPKAYQREITQNRQALERQGWVFHTKSNAASTHLD